MPLRVTVELIPHGDENNKRKIAVIDIENVGGLESDSAGDYRVRAEGECQEGWDMFAEKRINGVPRGDYLNTVIDCLSLLRKKGPVSVRRPMEAVKDGKDAIRDAEIERLKSADTESDDLRRRQREHLDAVTARLGGGINQQSCLHDGCPNCIGTGVRADGSMCIHMISCPCPKCSPICAVCGKGFVARVYWQQACSPKCSKKMYKDRKRKLYADGKKAEEEKPCSPS